MIRLKVPAERGYALIEAVVAVAISSAVLAAIGSVLVTAQKTYTAHQSMSDMMHNARAAIFHIEKDLKGAGCDPTCLVYDSSLYPLIEAGRHSITLSCDLYNNSGMSESDGDIEDSGEVIRYSLYDSGSDGDTDLGRKKGSGYNKPVAENIDALDFTYLDGEDGISTDIYSVKSVIICVVARADGLTPGYIGKNDYSITLPDGTEKLIYEAQEDGYKRVILSSKIFFRNFTDF